MQQLNFYHFRCNIDKVSIFRVTTKELPGGKFQLVKDYCMMEDAGEVKFSCGYVETKAKLIVEINEEWRRQMEDAKGGTLKPRILP